MKFSVDTSKSDFGFRGEVLGVREWGGIKKKERECLLISQTSETASN
jgi:hypothetical protein